MRLSWKTSPDGVFATDSNVDRNKDVEFEFYVGEETFDVVQNVKVGSPALGIGQHRERPVLRIRAENTLGR